MLFKKYNILLDFHSALKWNHKDWVYISPVSPETSGKKSGQNYQTMVFTCLTSSSKKQ
jgi:hypothetical protein